MRLPRNLRYGDVAMLFHWLIALCIIGLIIVGKYMGGLEKDDPTRFLLTQWHKSFGISVLILAVLRIAWRFTHRPPPEPDGLPLWQKMAAGGTHLLLYVLMLALPITGWIMVSASPLNIDTMLFKVIPWPHFPGLTDLSNREDIAHHFHDYHHLAGTALIVLLLAHVGAALKHHFVDKDTIMLRMVPQRKSESFRFKLIGLLFVFGCSGAVLNHLYEKAQRQSVVISAGASEVSFVADVTGEETVGLFAKSLVEAQIDENTPGNSRITARVNTATISSANYQIAGSLPEPEWFDVITHPEALFESTDIQAGDEGVLNVTGNLTLKSTTKAVSFPMQLADEEEKRVARGEFTIDRRDFDIGLNSQANDDYVGFMVVIKFRFDVSNGEY